LGASHGDLSSPTAALGCCSGALRAMAPRPSPLILLRPPLPLLLAPLSASATALAGSVSAGSGQDDAQLDAIDMHSVLAALGLLSGAFFLVLLGLRIYLHCMRRRPQRRERRQKLTQEDIEARFPVTKCCEGGETCVVCLSVIEADEDCRVTQCGHTFHADCLMAWWTHKPRRTLRCPICRARQRTRDKKRKDDLHVPDIGTDSVTMSPSGASAPPSDADVAAAETADAIEAGMASSMDSDGVAAIAERITTQPAQDASHSDSCFRDEAKHREGAARANPAEAPGVADEEFSEGAVVAV